jgi:hypothetical protein
MTYCFYTTKTPGVDVEVSKHLFYIMDVSGSNFGSEARPSTTLSGLMFFLSNYSQIQIQKLVHLRQIDFAQEIIIFFISLPYHKN